MNTETDIVNRFPINEDWDNIDKIYAKGQRDGARWFANQQSESKNKEIEALNALCVESLSVLSKIIHAIQYSNMKGTGLHNEATDLVKKLMASPLKVNKLDKPKQPYQKKKL